MRTVIEFHELIQKADKIFGAPEKDAVSKINSAVLSPAFRRRTFELKAAYTRNSKLSPYLR